VAGKGEAEQPNNMVPPGKTFLAIIFLECYVPRSRKYLYSFQRVVRGHTPLSLYDLYYYVPLVSICTSSTRYQLVPVVQSKASATDTTLVPENPDNQVKQLVVG